MKVIKVEYSATQYQTKNILKSGKYGNRKSAAVTIAWWALSDNEEDSDGNCIGIEDVSNCMNLLSKYCYPYEASDFVMPSGAIPHNGNYTIPALTSALTSPVKTIVTAADLCLPFFPLLRIFLV